ncbi:hypothetical protein [Methylocystis sp. SC2]|uniref:hypothetical protein n=1 Tax=Methylocystis sp. (strain SC2) TaxID=187303 RepID=UPI0002D57087|nr:hypothetical protein [Methylocystis sp. SC2]
MAKSRFETSADVETCVEYLRKHQNSGLIAYVELSKTTGREIEGKDRYILASARRILEREGIFFVTETGNGVKRADDAQLAKLSTEEPIIKTRRIAKRARKRQSSVNIQGLTDEQRMAFWIGSAILGAIDQAASRVFRNAVEEASNTSDSQISLSKTIDLFNKMKSSSDRPQ